MKILIKKACLLSMVLIISAVSAVEDCQTCATDTAAWNAYNAAVRACFNKCNQNDGDCVAKCRADIKNPLKDCKAKDLKDCGLGCSVCITNEEANNNYIVAHWADSTKCNESCQKNLEACNKCQNACSSECEDTRTDTCPAECKATYGDKCPTEKNGVCTQAIDDCNRKCGSSLTNPFVAPDPAELCSADGFTDCAKSSGGAGKVNCGGGCIAACNKAGGKPSIRISDFNDCAAGCMSTDGAIIDCANSKTNTTCSYDPVAKKVTCESSTLAKVAARKTKAKLAAAKAAKAASSKKTDLSSAKSGALPAKS